MNKSTLLKVGSPLVLALVILIIIESPLFLVGEYPMFSAFISMLLVLISSLTLLYAFLGKYEKQKWFSNLLMVMVLSGSAALLFGTYFTGTRFEKAKSFYLSENGTLTKAIISDKKSFSVRRRGRKSTSYQLYFAFKTKEGEQVTSWEQVTDDEFFSVREGQFVTVAYSEEDSKLIDLILQPEKKQIYKVKLADFKNQ